MLQRQTRALLRSMAHESSRQALWKLRALEQRLLTSMGMVEHGDRLETVVPKVRRERLEAMQSEMAGLRALEASRGTLPA
jgi:hypothetical protein